MSRLSSIQRSKYKALEEERWEDAQYFNILEQREIQAIRDYPPVIGTKPELIVYQYLLSLGIRFQYQYFLADNPQTFRPESVWKPDFMLPDYNVIIEVYGEYWHSLPQNREDDELKRKYALLNGYVVLREGIAEWPSDRNWNGGKYVIWWESEIYQDIAGLFARDLPEIAFAPVKRGVPDIMLERWETLKIKQEKALAKTRAAKMVPKVRGPKISAPVLRARRYDKIRYQLPSISPRKTIRSSRA